MDMLCRIVLCYRYLGPVPHDTSYYAKCMLGGALACGFTHAGITPLDVTKCNMQVRVLTSFLILIHYSLGCDYDVEWIALCDSVDISSLSFRIHSCARELQSHRSTTIFARRSEGALTSTANRAGSRLFDCLIVFFRIFFPV